MKVGLVVNPAAAGGRMKSIWREVAAAAHSHFGEVEVRLTDAPGDAAVIARAFAEQGFDVVVAAGGDGTASEAADGLLQGLEQGATTAALGIIPLGTGSDFARSLGHGGGFEASLARIAAGASRRIDAGRASFVDDAGRLASRHFVNVASLGLSGPIARAVNAARLKRRVSGKGLFYWHSILSLIRYRFQDVRITIDDAAPVEVRIALLAVANGRFFGGGMMIAPDAELDDGILDIVIVRAVSKWTLIRNIHLLYSGAHGNHPAITFVRGRRVVVEPLGDQAANAALIDIDGETPGRIPVTVEVLPKALEISG
jgi:YegS/Rv2252/BmrU family lipid kinase